MTQGQKTKTTRSKTYRPQHEKPGPFRLDYILLPYGAYYEKTRVFLDAKKGDKMRFFNGPEVLIEDVRLIEDINSCDVMCRVRYGVSWHVAYERWLSYARMEGNNRDIISKNCCIAVFFGIDIEANDE